jgi:hypothetical protein
MRARILVAAFALMMATSIGLTAQAPVDVTGKWLFAVETSAGGGTPTVTLKQEGEKLTGHYSSTQLGEAELSGSVKGTAITFAFGTDVQGTHLDVTYSGTIEGKDSMKGKVNLGGLGEGTFTAKRQ